MGKYLYEEEEKIFLEETEAKTLFSDICDADIWKRVISTNELNVVPIDNAPILMQHIRNKFDIEPSVSDDSMTECMESINLGLSVPMENKYQSYPLGSTALGSLVQRAGYQSSPVLMVLTQKARQKTMPPEKKAEVLNCGLNCYNNSSLVLIRDEKIRAVLSGDESDYSPLRFDELVEALETGLKNQFSEIHFSDASASHEYFTISYVVKDQNLLKGIADELKKAGIPTGNMKLAVRLVSSDVGISGANIYPLLRTSAGERIIGWPLVLTHKNKHNITDFESNVDKILALFKESEQIINKMQNTKVKHPAGCLLRVCKQVGLSKKISCEEAPNFESAYSINCSFLDVYWKAFELLDDCFAQGNMTNSRKMNLEENICRIAFGNIEGYDLPFQWE